jgi:hypothetical protein
MYDMQDVYDSRRDNTFAQRLASIREKDRAATQAADNESEGRASTSALAPVMSNTSQQRSRVFGRARSKSKVQPPGGQIV